MRILRVWLFLLLTSIYAFCLAQEPANLRDEPQLQKRLSLRAKLQPLQEFVRVVAEQTGVRLGIDKRYEQEKITLFVKERPAWELLERVAEVVDLEWRSAETGGYFLARSERRKEQEQAIQKARAEKFLAIENTLFKGYQRTAQLDYLELTLRADQLSAELEQIVRQKPPGWQERVSQLQSELNSLEETLLLPSYFAGKITSAWQRNQWQMLWQGRPYIACYPSDGTLPELPSQFLEWAVQATARRPRNIPPDLSDSHEPETTPPQEISQQINSILFFIKYDAYRELLSWGVYTENGISQTMSLSTEFSGIVETLKSGAIPLSLDESLKAVKLVPSQGRLRRDDLSTGYTLAEELEWIADQCEIPIIAQAFRVMRHESLDQPIGANNLYEWATLLTEREPYAVEYKNGYLQVRYTLAPLLRLREIPESQLQSFEQRHKEKQSLSIDDYAELVSLLTPDQERFFTSPYVGGYYLKPAVRFDVTPIASASPALRFWASLNPSQRKQALDAAPLYYSQLTLTQQRLFVEAIEASETYYSTGKALELIPYAYDPLLSERLAFFLDRWSDEEWIVEHDNVRITFESREDAQNYIHQHLAGQFHTLRQGGSKKWSFHFGVSIPQSVAYQMAQTKGSQ